MDGKRKSKEAMLAYLDDHDKYRQIDKHTTLLSVLRISQAEKKSYPGYDTNLCLMMRLQFGRSGE